MPYETIELTAPVQFIDLAKHDNPAFQFYFKWATNLMDDELLERLVPSRFFSDSCSFILPDSTKVQGTEKIIGILRESFRHFAKIEREALRIVLVTDPSSGSHDLHVNILLTLWKSLDDDDPIRIPQAIFYKIRKAAEHQGTDGLQITQMWHAYDQKIVEEAQADIQRQNMRREYLYAK